MSFQEIILLLTTYKYLFLFPVVVVEGPIITVIAGFLSSTGYLNLFIAYAVILIGDITGDSLYYCLGRWGSIRFINRWGHYVGLTIERVKKIKQHFINHTGKTIIIGKFAHSIEIPFLIAAGFAKVPYHKFLLYVFIPSVPKSLLFILIGYYFGRAYGEINKYLGYSAFFMMATAISFTVIYFVIKKMSKKYTENNQKL